MSSANVGMVCVHWYTTLVCIQSLIPTLSSQVPLVWLCGWGGKVQHCTAVSEALRYIQ